jgi:hypothetical protein
MTALDNVNDIQFDHHMSNDNHHVITATRTIRGGSPEEDDDEVVGQLDWHKKTGRIAMVEVDSYHQRQGIATHMHTLAQGFDPKPRHSDDRTNAGTAWATSVGGHLPKLKPSIMDRPQ